MPLNELHHTRIIYLVSGYINDTLRLEEMEELDAWRKSSPSNESLFGELTDPVYRKEHLDYWLTEDTEKSLERLKSKRRITSGNKRLLWPYAAVAAVFLTMCFYYYIFQYKTSLIEDNTTIVSDVKPGSNKAILRLADGSTVLLDDSGEGIIALQSGTTISKSKDSSIEYHQGNNPEIDQILYNTIEIPKGGQYQVRLPDGSQVWLNAASTLKYPVSFKMAERRVELSGEAYFEVAHNKKQPFIVASGKQEVTVLGTAFNVNAYKDEGVVTTTLQNGSIRLSGNKKTTPVLLRPGEQAVTAGHGFRVQQVNVNDFISWKDGLIVLNDADLPTIIRQIERWYDVEFVVPEISGTVKVFGELRRNVNLSEVLKALHDYYGLNFKIEGRRVIASK